VRFSSETPSNKTFSFVLEEVDSETSLFDGIAEPVNEVYLYSKTPKYFYYKINAIKAIKVFISSDDAAADFFLVAKVVSS
jgi:hypothetical protein